MYSISIYILLCMFILLQKPTILYDNNGNIKSWNYLKDKLIYGFNDAEELICLPTLFVGVSLLSFIISIKIIE